jgi:hypothetical protein
MDYHELLDHHPWAADHKNAIITIAKFLQVDFETVLQQFDERILGKVAKEHFQLSKAA